MHNANTSEATQPDQSASCVDARDIATKLRDLYWDGIELPIQPADYAAANEIKVYHADFPDPSIDHGEGPRQVHTIVSPPGTGARVILVDWSRGTDRRRMATAVGLGRILAERYSSTVDSSPDSKRERGCSLDAWAQSFADALLMPNRLLRRAVKDGASDAEISLMFDVPEHHVVSHRERLAQQSYARATNLAVKSAMRGLAMRNYELMSRSG